MKKESAICPKCDKPLWQSSRGSRCYSCGFTVAKVDLPGAIGGVVGPKVELHKSPKALWPAHAVIASR